MFTKDNIFYQEDIDYVLNRNGIEKFYGKTFIITGATGLIGMHLIDVLMKLNNVIVYAFGRNKMRMIERLGEYLDSGKFHFFEHDVNQPLPVELVADYIIPLASNTHPQAYSNFPIETMLTNINGAYYALEHACRCGATVLYPSTVEVYGNARNQDVFKENYTGILNLSTSRACYTESKRACEALCQSYIAERNANVNIARLSRIFGPTMLFSDTKASSQFLLKALAGEDIILKSKGDQFFSYTYVSDAVAAMLHILLYGENGVAYNISCDECNVTLKDFAQECATLGGKQVVFELPKESEQKGYSIANKAILDNTKLKNIGFKSKYDYKTAILRTLEILKDREI